MDTLTATLPNGVAGYVCRASITEYFHLAPQNAPERNDLKRPNPWFTGLTYAPAIFLRTLCADDHEATHRL